MSRPSRLNPPVGASDLTSAMRKRATPLRPGFMSFSKGGVVGTNGKTPVALRFDDWQDNIKSGTLLTDLRSRGMFGSIVLCSRLKTQNWNQVVTYTDITDWNRNYGMEIWSHGTDHITPWDANPDKFEANLVREVITSRQEIEAQGLRVMGWAKPGVATHDNAVPGYGNDLLTQADWDSVAGQLLSSNYALVETDMTGNYRNLPSQQRYGLGHVTVSDGATLQSCKDALDAAISLGKGIEFMAHVGNFGLGGNMTYANFVSLLDYIVTKRDAGLVEFVTPSTLAYCDPSSSRRLDLLGNGELTAAVSSSFTGEGNWQGVDTTHISKATVADGVGGATHDVLRSNTNGFYAKQQINKMIGTGVAGQTWLFDFWARGVGGSSGVRIGAQAANIADYEYKQAAIPVTTSWQHVRYPFTPPPTQDSMAIVFGMGFGSTTTVEFAKLHVYVA